MAMARAISTVVQTLLLFSTLYKYIHRQYFLFFFFVHDYRSGVQFVQVTSCAINTVEHWGGGAWGIWGWGLSEEVSTTHMFRP